MTILKLDRVWLGVALSHFSEPNHHNLVRRAERLFAYQGSSTVRVRWGKEEEKGRSALMFLVVRLQTQTSNLLPTVAAEYWPLVY